MATRIEIVPHQGVDEGLVTQIRTWASQVLERAEPLFAPPYLCITIWQTTEQLQLFYRKEKEELGIVTGEEADFLATHEAWRGHPRIHICQERLSGIPDSVVQGVIHHEISHALHHGSREFYTFRFSTKLQEVGRSYGLDLPLLQQLVYFLSVAIKDGEVMQWLAEAGLGFSQCALLEHLISETEEERSVWEVARSSSVIRKIACAAFLKTVLPIETLVSIGVADAQALKNKWHEAYRWISERQREGLFQFARSSLKPEGKTFQERLDGVTLRLISDPSL